MPVTVLGGPHLPSRRDTYLDVIELRQYQNEASEQADADGRDRKPHGYRHLVALFAQQRLYFWPLPQGQGALRPTADIGHLSPEPDASRRASDAIVELMSLIRKP